MGERELRWFTMKNIPRVRVLEKVWSDIIFFCYTTTGVKYNNKHIIDWKKIQFLDHEAYDFLLRSTPKYVRVHHGPTIVKITSHE